MRLPRKLMSASLSFGSIPNSNTSTTSSAQSSSTSLVPRMTTLSTHLYNLLPPPALARELASISPLSMMGRRGMESGIVGPRKAKKASRRTSKSPKKRMISQSALRLNPLPQAPLRVAVITSLLSMEARRLMESGI